MSKTKFFYLKIFEYMMILHAKECALITCKNVNTIETRLEFHKIAVKLIILKLTLIFLKAAKGGLKILNQLV